MPAQLMENLNLKAKKQLHLSVSQKILIIRGIGGRETLRKGLEKKGGLITYGECYTRKYLQIDLEEVRKSTYEFNRIFMLITSYESAKKFMQHNITDHLGWLKSIHVIVNHIRLKNELNIFSNLFISNPSPCLISETLVKASYINAICGESI